MILSCVNVCPTVPSSATSKAALRKEKKRAMLGDIGSGWGVGDSGRTVGGVSNSSRGV